MHCASTTISAAWGDPQHHDGSQRPHLAALSTLLRAIAAGDLSTRMQGDFHGVFAVMRDMPNSTVQHLTQIVANPAVGSPASACRRRDRRRQQRPVAPYRTAGCQPGRNPPRRWKTDLHRAPERRPRAAGQRAGRFRGGRGQRSGQVSARWCTPWSRSRRLRSASPEIISVIDALRSRPTSWR